MISMSTIIARMNEPTIVSGGVDALDQRRADTARGDAQVAS